MPKAGKAPLLSERRGSCLDPCIEVMQFLYLAIRMGMVPRGGLRQFS